jgi:hypothetical protein
VKLSKRMVFALLGLLVLLLGASQLLSGRSNGALFTESELQTELDAGRIKSVNFERDARKVTGELKTPIATGKFRGKKTFTATYRTESEEALVDLGGRQECDRFGQCQEGFGVDQLHSQFPPDRLSRCVGDRRGTADRRSAPFSDLAVQEVSKIPLGQRNRCR